MHIAGNDLSAGDLGDDAAHQCSAKCTDNQAEGCSGYVASDETSNALCVPEAQCREICSGLSSCYGIDMSTGGDRCYLNRKGEATDGCQAQYQGNTLGSSLAYKFLVKDGSYGRRLQEDTRGYGLSDDEVLRFQPVSFTTGGSYKVCFCDSSLLPAGQEHCLAESDYDIHAGDLVVSGVSCLLAKEDFRRRTCYSMFHGGLACADDADLVLPNDDSLVTEANTSPSSFALY